MQTDPRRNSIDAAGCTLHYSVRGSGDPILFIQGAGVHGEGWKPQTDEFAGRHACICFDNRGVGRSQPVGERPSIERMARDGLAVLDAARVSAAHVVGHSLGGQVALQLALLEPGRVRSLSLLCTFADGREPARGGRMLWLGMRSRVGTARMRRRAFLEIIFPPQMLRDVDLDPLAAQMAVHFGHDLSEQPSVVMAQIGAFRRCNLAPRLAELAHIPTLVVSAAHDLIAPPSLGKAIAAGIPGSRYVEFADAGHGLPISHAARVNALLGEQFASVR